MKDPPMALEHARKAEEFTNGRNAQEKKAIELEPSNHQFQVNLELYTGQGEINAVKKP